MKDDESEEEVAMILSSSNDVVMVTAGTRREPLETPSALQNMSMIRSDQWFTIV